MLVPRYVILETDQGPMISESRVTVYDVMLLEARGRNLYEIATVLNLTPLQVGVALDYIAHHRETLESDLREIRVAMAEREAYYRALAAEREREIAQRPMTPERAAFEALRSRRNDDNGDDVLRSERL